jgi:hypothetical protein
MSALARNIRQLGGFGVLLSILYGGGLFAAPPVWWSDSGTKVLDSNLTPNNQGPVNLGQLKNMAKMARIHLNNRLSGSGGAGGDIDSLVAGFGTNLTSAQKADQYKPINLGQLKYVAKWFYTRLYAVGYDSRGNLISHNYPSDWPYYTPWNPYASTDDNYAPVTIGQLKMVFSFDLGSFTINSSGIPDWWQKQYFNGQTGIDPTLDPDQDGLSNLQEYQGKDDPTKKDNPLIKLKVGVVVR